jgi:hypothetical protein
MTSRRDIIKRLAALAASGALPGSNSVARGLEKQPQNQAPISGHQALPPVNASVGWEEILNSDLKSAWTKDFGLPEFPKGVGGNSGAGSILSAWNSGCLDTRRNRFVLPRGGGHADFAGNQVVAFNLNTHTWQLLEGYSNNYPYSPWRLAPNTDPGIFGPVYADGKPASMHTYNSVEYDPVNDAVYSMGGIYWSNGGESVPKLWKSDGVTWKQSGTYSPLGFKWDPTNSWQEIAKLPRGYGRQIIWDGVLKRIWYRRSDYKSYIYYDPATNAFAAATGRSTQHGPLNLEGCLCIDERGRKLYYVSPARNGLSASICSSDLSVADSDPAADEILLGSASVDVRRSTSLRQPIEGIGAFFDPSIGKIVLLGRHPTDPTKAAIYMATPKVGFSWEFRDSAVSPPAPGGNGVWKKFFKHKDAYYFIRNNWTKNVWRFGGAVGNGVGRWQAYPAHQGFLRAGVTSLKQCRWDYCPDDRKIYTCGGDIVTSESRDMFALNPTDSSWEVVQRKEDYSGVPATEFPPTGDCFCWTWCTSTRLFFMAYGYNFAYRGGANPDARYQASWDPVTRKWRRRAPYIMGGGEQSGHGVYDPTTDKVIKWANHPGLPFWYIDPKTSAYTSHDRTPRVIDLKTSSQGINLGDVVGYIPSMEYRVDVAGRKVWMYMTINAKLYYWHIDNHKLVYVGQNPHTPEELWTLGISSRKTLQYQKGFAPLNYSGYGVGAMVWTGTRLLIPIHLTFSHPRIYQLVAYTPSTGVWEKLWEDLTPDRPACQAHLPHGERTAWDPVNKRMYLLGRTGSHNFWYWQEP